MWLLVSFIFWNDTTCLIHWEPVPGESGWTKILVGISGSALPVTDHSELWNLYLLSSAAMRSKTKTYSSLGFKPLILTLITGNMRLLRRKRFAEKYLWKWIRLRWKYLLRNIKGVTKSFCSVGFFGWFFVEDLFAGVNLGKTHGMILHRCGWVYVEPPRILKPVGVM